MKYAEFNGGVHIFFCFRPEKPFLGKFGQKNSEKVQSETLYLDQFRYAELNGSAYFICFRPKNFGNLIQKIKVDCWSWNLGPTIIHKIFETNSCEIAQ